MTDLEPGGQKERFSRQNFLKLGAAATASALLAACGINPRKIGTQPETPEPTGTQEPTSTPESETPPDLSITGYIESDPKHPEDEIIKFDFSEGFTDGEKPLFVPNDIAIFQFDIDSALPPKEIVAGAKNILGVDIPYSESKEVGASPSQGFSISEMAKLLPEIGKSFNKEVRIGETSLEVISVMKLVFGQVDGKTRVQIVLPNASCYYTDERGDHNVNPLQRFLKGEMGVEIRRIEKPEDGTAAVPPDEPINVTDFQVFSVKQNTTVYKQESGNVLELQAPRTVKITSGERAGSTESGSQPIPAEESKWVKEWEPNETISIREWWNNMVAKGYIKVDPSAEKFAGEEINNFLGNNLVPNPQDYHKTGKGFMGNCTTTLQDLISKSQGHISVAPEAFAQIPGGQSCQIFVK